MGPYVVGFEVVPTSVVGKVPVEGEGIAVEVPSSSVLPTGVGEYVGNVPTGVGAYVGSPPSAGVGGRGGKNISSFSVIGFGVVGIGVGTLLLPGEGGFPASPRMHKVLRIPSFALMVSVEQSLEKSNRT